MLKNVYKSTFLRFWGTGFLCMMCIFSYETLNAQAPARVAQPPRPATYTTLAAPAPYAAAPVQTASVPRTAPTVVPLRPTHVHKIINPQAEKPAVASTSTKTRGEIIQKIPFQRMTVDAQQKVRGVLSDITMYRRLPVETVPCEEDMYVFLTKHPDVVVNIWEVLQVSSIRLKEIGPERFYMEDQAGTQGTMECIYRADNFMIIYVSGTYEGPPFPTKVSGSGVMILQHEPIIGPAGEKLVAIRLDSFIKIHNGTVDFLAKTFQGPLGKVADSNMNQTVGFIGALTRTIYQDGESVQRVAPQLKHVRPEVRQEFASLTGTIIKRREQELFGGPLPVAVQPSQGEWMR